MTALGRPLVSAALAGAAVAVGAASASAPIVTIVVIGGALAATALARSPLAATALLVGSFFFDEILSSGGLVTPGKLIGVVAAGAWMLDTIRNQRPVVLVPHLWPLGLLCVWLVPSLGVVEDSALGLTVATRYLMFATLFFLVVQTTRGRYERSLAVADVAVIAAAAAAVIGLVGFVWGGEFRASGPIGDPNDFGFLIGSTLPLSAWRRTRWHGSSRWNPFTITTILIGAATLATFSRGAVLALALTGVWAVATGRVPLRKGVAALLFMATISGLGYLLLGDLVTESVERKAVVARDNVDSRFDSWGVALDQFRSAPITGVGPGQFEVRYTDFAPPPEGVGYVITTHNAYLNVLAELGLPGLLAFLGYLALCWRSLRRPAADVEVDEFRGAVAGCFLVAVIGAFFLTEQFYAPLWMFGALGAVDLVRDKPRPGRQARVATTSSISRS